MSSVIQTASGSSTTSSLTLTFSNPIGWGNSLAIALIGYVGGSVSSITLGTTGGTFDKQVASPFGNNCEIWANTEVHVLGANTVTITTSVAGVIANAYEVHGAITGSFGSGTLTLDKSSSRAGTGTAWTSGTTAATF